MVAILWPKTSNWDIVNRGCPQVSALGLLLWNMLSFENDLTYEIKSDVSMYSELYLLYQRLNCKIAFSFAILTQCSANITS